MPGTEVLINVSYYYFEKQRTALFTFALFDQTYACALWWFVFYTDFLEKINT